MYWKKSCYVIQSCFRLLHVVVVVESGTKYYIMGNVVWVALFVFFFGAGGFDTIHCHLSILS